MPPSYPGNHVKKAKIQQRHSVVFNPKQAGSGQAAVTHALEGQV